MTKALHTLELVPRSKGSHHSEKPEHGDKEEPHSPQLEKATETRRSQESKSVNISLTCI